MKLTKQQESEALNVYHLFWNSYIGGDLETFASTLDDAFEMIGTSETEVAHSKADGIAFYKAQMQEVVGKAEMRNRNISVKPLNGMFLINENCDIYVFGEPEWTFYSRIRISTLLHETDSGWKVIQQHGSLPDMRVQEGETLAIDKITKENLELRDAIKRRTAELENKNRELEIEAALERIRAQATAMKESSDLLDIVVTMRTEFVNLGHEAHYFWHMRWLPDTYEKAMTSGDGSRIGMVMTLPRHIHGDIEPVAEWEKSDEPTYVLAMDVDTAVDYVDKMITLGDFEQVDPQAPTLDDIRQIVGLTFIMARTTHGEIGYSLPGVVPDPPKDAVDTLVRFAGVFDLAYKRFEDLKKAEAQARETQIELALERVRARTMAMQHSDELIETSELMFDQIKNLGIELWSCGFSLWYDDDSYFLGYNPGPDGKMGEPLKIPLTEDVFFTTIRDARRRGDEFLVFESEGESLEQTYRYMDKLPVVGETMRGFVEAGYPLPTYQVTHCGFFSEGHLMFITQEPNPKAIDIFKRFTKVFDQTYTRFLDLQKAEEQAREAKIETALEKVRSRSLAMHKSDELNEVVKVLFEKMTELEVPSTAVAIQTFTEGSKDMQVFVCGDVGTGIVINQYLLPYFHHPIIHDYLEAHEKDLDFYVGTYSKKEKDSFYDVVLKRPGLKDLPAEVKTMIRKSEFYEVTMVPAEKSLLAINDFHGDSLSDSQVNILKRFARVFDQTYTRFLDLKKAEAQARESEIQLALERVRARSMAMHQSDELADLSLELVKQVQALGIDTWFCAFNIYDDHPDGSIEWGSNGQGTFPSYRTPREGVFLNYYEAGQRGESLLINEIGEDECPAHYDYLCSLPGVGDQLLKMKDEGIPFPASQIDHVAFFKYGYIIFITFESAPEAHEIFERFAKVFQQTYTRFLDLKKAEEQAREAKIETALEKIRSRTMAMQKGEELQEVAVLLYKELIALGVTNFVTCGYVEVNEEIQRQHTWVTAPGGDTMGLFHLPLTGDDTFDARYAAWKKQQTVFHQSVAGQVRSNHLEYAITTFNSKEAEEMVRIQFPDPTVFYCFNFSHGYLHIVGGSLLEKEEENLLARFTKVFEQTYTRFLDLQKAEEQAREAKIEMSLEKIRSRTMGMQGSEELPEVANMLFLEVQELGIPAWSCGYCILEEDRRSSICIMSSEGTLQKPFLLPHHGEVSFEEWDDFVQGDQTFFTQELGGKAIESHYDFMKSLPQLGPVLKDIEEAGLSLPEYQINHLCKFAHGFLLFITYEPVADSHDIFKRFTKVFDQTYTRFLDLKKAEKQARESSIEAALERVRAKALAMHSSEDLRETITCIFEELKNLNVRPLRMGLGLLDPDKPQGEVVTSRIDESGEIIEVSGNFALVGHPVLDSIYDHFKKQADHFPVLEGEQIDSYYAALTQSVDVKGYGTDSIHYGCFLYFPEGALYAWAPEPHSDAQIQILSKFTRVVEITYRRYNDLVEAEAREKEAVKQASLDRVRAEIASMRSTKDLESITPLVWRELTTLGIPFIRCGVFIIHEEEKEVEVYLSKPDGTSLAVMHLPFGSSELAVQTVSAWQEKRVYTQQWTREEFLDWGRSMMEQGQVQNMETYQGAEEAPESLHLHFIPFNQGMLYVGSTGPLNDEEISLSESLAKAFSIAYARYEDFVKLEKAKAGIEDALTELKATQSQLVQQEKLASLGQLTAGIAHEIKNPLNFVNNFSEVSVELIEETKEELSAVSDQLSDEDKERVDEALDILNDIDMNLRKINEHGSRADSIVKSMLEHSRGGSGKMEPTDLNGLVKEFVNLSFHGMRASKNPMNVDIDLQLDENIGEVPLIAEDFSRVIVNLVNNGFDAMREKTIKNSELKIKNYSPKLTVRTMQSNTTVTVQIEDNGSGIPDEMKDKILQPFFTTKKGTEGTGLGLSITNDIIKAHGGSIEIKSTSGEGSTFIIQLPKSGL